MNTTLSSIIQRILEELHASLAGYYLVHGKAAMTIELENVMMAIALLSTISTTEEQLFQLLEAALAALSGEPCAQNATIATLVSRGKALREIWDRRVEDEHVKVGA